MFSQDRLSDFDSARRLFWNAVYPAGGWTLYCGLRFEAGGNGDGVMVTIDHIYPMPRVYQQLQCGSRLRCKREQADRYNHIEADLHNMYPASGTLVVARSDTVFSEVDGNESRYQDCSFKRRSRLIEPRDIAKGNIARSLLYMHAEYGLALQEDIELLKAWSRVDPPSEQEISRNDIIERVQGNRNPFIDEPELVDRF
ncbi:MAG: endonuclease [Gammaproteobacteria bacterium]|nr:endonuclease [Gammaproteobacteria bacterium]